MNSAMYLIGPTSASSFLYSPSSLYFSSVSVSISVLAVLIRRFCSSTCASMSAVLSALPTCVRKRLINLFDSATSRSALRRRRLISAPAARACGLFVACSIFVSNALRSSCLAVFQSPIFSAVFLPNTPSALAPIICCAFLVSPLSI